MDHLPPVETRWQEEYLLALNHLARDLAHTEKAPELRRKIQQFLSSAAELDERVMLRQMDRLVRQCKADEKVLDRLTTQFFRDSHLGVSRGPAAPRGGGFSMPPGGPQIPGRAAPALVCPIDPSHHQVSQTFAGRKPRCPEHGLLLVPR